MTKPTLTVLEGTFAIFKKAPEDTIPPEIFAEDFFSITKTLEELSIVCRENILNGNPSAEKGWKCLRAEGPLDFSLTGILSNILEPLATAGISIFALSTYNTDYILVKEEKLKDAVEKLESKGYQVKAPDHKPF